MKKLFCSPVLFILFFLSSLAVQAYGASQPTVDNPANIFYGDRYLRMANNFFIVYDPSDTMDVPYRDTGLTRLEAEKQILLKSNASLPELGWQTGLYPHWKGGLWLHGPVMAFEPYYELKRYEQVGYRQALDQLPVRPTGPPMLQRGLMKLDLLLGLSGRTQVFIFSDGKHSTAPELEKDPLTQARILAEKYDVCFNIVSSAVTADEKKLLSDIASVNSCSQVIAFDTVFEKPEHLFGKLYMDTEQPGYNNVLFDFDKYVLKEEFKPTLDELGEFLLGQPNAYVVLSGFCDSKGTKAYNDKLSKKRVATVNRYLRNHFDIQEGRILPYWYGYANPVASNETAEGRALNRRVTIGIRLGTPLQ